MLVFITMHVRNTFKSFPIREYLIKVIAEKNVRRLKHLQEENVDSGWDTFEEI